MKKLFLSMLCALPLHGMDKQVLLKFENAFSREESSPFVCYLAHPGYGQPSNFKLPPGKTELELTYNDRIAQGDYSIYFQANECPATKEEQQTFLHAYPDTNRHDAHYLQVCTQLHFYLKIGRYVRIIHPQKELTLPPADEITFKIQRDENNHDLFSVLVAVAQSPEFNPSRDWRKLQGLPIAYRRETNLSMKTPMGSEKIIDFPLTHNQDSE